jgi:diguanylate cyclase (GGDEF)-like protein
VEALQSVWNQIPLEALPFLLALGMCLWIARGVGRASQRPALREAEQRAARAEASAKEQRRWAVEATQRAEQAEATAEALKRSLAELPEIAQRLSDTQSAREIPSRALELVQEIFDASYAVFYRHSQNGLVAVATQGECEIGMGHQLQTGQGLVGWAALKQLPLTPEEIQFESGVARGRNLREGVPEQGFSLCLPVLHANRTVGVILVGPYQRQLPQALALGRTIALMTSVAINNNVALREQEQLAQTDGLTGLLNKSRVVQQIAERIADTSPTQPISVFLFDIDHFKHYNDANGHLPGDELLRALGKLLQDSLREGESVGRYGGEEFLMVLPGVEKSEAFMAADRIRAAIARHPFRFREEQPLGRISISGGVATWPTDGPDADSLIRSADEALYEAKREGRNCVVPYAPPDLVRRSELLPELEGDPTDEQKEPPAEA